jgi:hypothetical protein
MTNLSKYYFYLKKDECLHLAIELEVTVDIDKRVDGVVRAED